MSHLAFVLQCAVILVGGLLALGLAFKLLQILLPYLVLGWVAWIVGFVLYDITFGEKR